MSARSIFPRRAVFQSATPAGRTSRRSPPVVCARTCVRACVHAQAWRNAAWRNASVVQCTAGAWVLVRGCGAMCFKQEGKSAGREEGRNPEQEQGAARVLRGHRGWRGRLVRPRIRRKAPCARMSMAMTPEAKDELRPRADAEPFGGGPLLLPIRCRRRHRDAVIVCRA